MSKLPRTRGEARALGTKRYFTGKRCVNNHLSDRYTINSACLECRREYDKGRDQSHYQNSDKYKAYQKEYHKKYDSTDRGKAIKQAANDRWRARKAAEKLLNGK